MKDYSRSALLQIRSHLISLIALTGVTDERLNQLKVVEKLLADKDKNAA